MLLLCVQGGLQWAGQEAQRLAARQRCAVTTPRSRRKDGLVQKHNSGTKIRMPGEGVLGACSGEHSVNCWGSGNRLPIKD